MSNVCPTRRDRRSKICRRVVPVCTAVLVVAASTATVAAGIPARRSLPPSLLFDRGPSDGVQRVEMPEVDVAPLIAEDQAIARSGEPHRPRFATPIDTALGPHNAGRWETLTDGSELWRLRIGSPSALNLNLGLERFHLPAGGAMWIHDPDGAQVHGPYTAHDQNGAGGLWTPIVVGDEIELEVVVPSGTRDQVAVEITSVNHGYRPFGGISDFPHTKQGDCNIDVICPEGDPWRRQIRSVARISVVGIFWCSATLLNNIAEDDTPYLLTAQHCVETAGEARSLVAYWNYESPTCGLLSGGNPLDNQNGAELVASWQHRTGSDFSLLELDDLPDEEFGVYYAGWDATGSTPQGAVGIHHPRADEKAISFDHDPLTRDNYYGYGEHQWRIGAWELGTTEGGSSGSCIFEPSSGLCVGTLTWGLASCDRPDEYDIYGSFDVHWTGNGTPTTRLSDWLDPAASGRLSLEGREPGGGGGGGGGGQSLWLLPAAASAPGAQGSNWKSQIVVVNPTNTALAVELNFTAEGVSWPGVPLLAEPAIVAAGQSLYVDDPLGSRNPTSGMLYALLDGRGGVVSSRTYNLEPDGATFGQGIPGVLVDGQPVASTYILPLVHNAPGVFRTNVGVVQTSSGGLTVRISAHSPTGAFLGSGTFASPSAFRQINNIFRELGIEHLQVEGGWLEVDLLGPPPSYWTCYASVIDSRTNDPTYVLPVEP